MKIMELIDVISYEISCLAEDAASTTHHFYIPEKDLILMRKGRLEPRFEVSKFWYDLEIAKKIANGEKPDLPESIVLDEDIKRFKYDRDKIEKLIEYLEIREDLPQRIESGMNSLLEKVGEQVNSSR